jgi:hypothetical protein
VSTAFPSTCTVPALAVASIIRQLPATLGPIKDRRSPLRAPVNKIGILGGSGGWLGMHGGRSTRMCARMGNLLETPEFFFASRAQCQTCTS